MKYNREDYIIVALCAIAAIMWFAMIYIDGTNKGVWQWIKWTKTQYTNL